MRRPFTTLVTAALAAPLLFAGAPAASAATAATTTAAVSAIDPSLSCNQPTYVASPTERLVVAWYQQFLGTGYNAACDDPGRLEWVALLDAGATREQVLGSMVRSTRYASQKVGGLYQRGFGRSPDRGALFWLDGLRAGMEPEWVEQNVLASPEWEAHRGSRSSARQADDLWNTISAASAGSRRATEAEAADTSARLQRDRRLDVVRHLWYSPDAVRSRLDAAFRDVLRRSPTADEIAWWTPVEIGSDLRTRVLLASTAEYPRTYESRYQYGDATPTTPHLPPPTTTPDIPTGCGAAAPTATLGQVLVDGWAHLQARWVLAQPCADPARAPHVQRLDAGAPRSEVFEAVSRDQASSTMLRVYYGLLGRGPDHGAQVWVDGLGQGMALEWVQQNVLASDEYARQTPTPYDVPIRDADPEGYRISNWYGNILGRSPQRVERGETSSRPEIDHWRGRLRAVGPLVTVREIWYSPEAVQHRVRQSFQQILDRQPTAGELAWWAPVAGRSDQELRSGLATTDEYAAMASWRYQYGF